MKSRWLFIRRTGCLAVLACWLLPAGATLAAADETARSTLDEPARRDRPRIGLVLSGGGARGAAHVGVLRVLHEHRIPVDFVVGTSMGALVGGLYASGMTAPELDTLARELNFVEVFLDGPAPEDIPIRQKLENYRNLLDLEIGFENDELNFSTGFIRGQRLNLLLRRLTLPVRHVSDFDALPTPFRAVATDLATAQRVEFSRGDIVTAMRGSMAIPGIFEPVPHAGMKLVDGGIVANLPVATAMAFDADVLIVVNVGTPLEDPDELNSPFAVSAQVIDGMMLNEANRSLELLDEDDIVISPDLEMYTSADFEAVDDIIARGRAAAEVLLPRLQALAISPRDWEDYLASRQAVMKPLPIVSGVTVSEQSQRFVGQLLARTDIALGEPFDPAALEDDLVRLHGQQQFGMIDYRLHGDPDDAASEIIEIEALPRRIGRQVAQFGVELLDDFEGDTRFQLLTGITFLDLNELGGSWRNDIAIGERTGIDSELYQPLRYDGLLFTSLRLRLQDQLYRADIPDGPRAEYRISDRIARVDIGLSLDPVAELRVGLRRGREKVDDLQGDPFLLAGEASDVGDVVVKFRYDSTDAVNFSTRGMRLGLAWAKGREWLGSEAPFEYAGLEAYATRNWLDENSLFWGGLELQSILEPGRKLSERITLGGPMRLSGLPIDSLIGRHGALAAVGYSHYLGDNRSALLNLPLYAGVTLETGNVWATKADVGSDDLIAAGSVFIGLDTGLGPVGLAYGRTDRGDARFYFTIGFKRGARLQPLLR